MTERIKEKEIHKTEYVDKKLPTIYYSHKNVKSLTEWSEDVIEVSDKTSNGALKTFKKIREESKEKCV